MTTSVNTNEIDRCRFCNGVVVIRLGNPVQIGHQSPMCPELKQELEKLEAALGVRRCNERTEWIDAAGKAIPIAGRA